MFPLVLIIFKSNDPECIIKSNSMGGGGCDSLQRSDHLIESLNRDGFGPESCFMSIG